MTHELYHVPTTPSQLQKFGEFEMADKTFESGPNIFPDLNDDRGSVKIVGGKKGVHDERLRQRFAKFMADHPHLTTTVLQRSDHIGLSRTMLDEYLEGKYFLKVNPKKSKLEPTLRAYLDRAEGIGQKGFDTGFVKTVLTSQLEFACNTAIDEDIIVVAYGSPGHGKSVALQQYVLDKLTTPPIRILCSRNITPGYFVRRLAKELRLTNLRSIPDAEDQIAESLIKNKRVLFIDQANYLDERGLGTICHIWERARIGVVLAGTYALYTLFATLTDKEDIKAQLSSRVGLFVPLQGLSLGEVKAIVQEALGEHATLEMTAAIFNSIAVTHRTESGSYQVASFRNLGFLLPRLKASIKKNEDEIADGTVDPVALVGTAKSRLMVG
jgi:DNA transposition AAA+ family ATPase